MPAHRPTNPSVREPALRLRPTNVPGPTLRRDGIADPNLEAVPEIRHPIQLRQDHIQSHADLLPRAAHEIQIDRTR